MISQFLKIFIKLYNDRLENVLNKYDILSPCQYGFRSNMPTYHALLELVEITTSIDNNKYDIGISVDLKYAFETVNHDILANK